jgi:hypothetical protein
MFIYRRHLLSKDNIYVIIYIVERTNTINILTADCWWDMYLLNALKFHVNPNKDEQYF